MGDNEIKKKKLLVTASTFPRWENDTEPRFVLDLAEAMTKYFDVTVLAPAAIGAKDCEIMNDVKVIRYHYFPIHKWETLCYPGAIVPRIKEKKSRIILVPFLLFSLYMNLFKLLHEFDYVHAHWLIPQGIIQSFFKKPYIVTGHGSDVRAFNVGLLKRLKIRCLKKAGYVTVVSEHLKKEVKILCDIEKVSVLSMGCKTEDFGKKFAVTDYFKQGEKKVVLFVGRLVEIKGVSYLIEAMKDVDAKLVIVGDGPSRQKLEIQAQTQADKIVFLGSKTHKELKKIYASADIFVMPSVTAPDGGKEGFGLVALEAMASGLPVVASKSGGITEIVTDGKNGILVEEKNVKELAEKINLLLNNKELYQEITENIKDAIIKYDYKTIAKDYKRLLEDLS